MHTPRLPRLLPFEVTLWTRWSDEDNQGVLNNAVTLTLCEEARRAFCDQHGILADNRFPFLLAASNTAFLRPGRGGVAVRAELGATAIGNSSFELVTRIGPAGEAPWSENEALLVCYDPETLAKAPLPKKLRTALEAILV